MSSSILDLRQCDPVCSDCIRQYAKKHNLGPNDAFQIPCDGIPKTYLPESILSSMEEDPQVAIAMIDPVTWAREFLDWHCIDPDGSIWKRKTEEGTIGESPPYDINRASIGKSIYNRPYQSIMLRCHSAKKVFRIGRQAGKCLISGTLIQMADGSIKPIEDIQDGDSIIGLDDSYNLVPAKAFKRHNGIRSVAKLKLMDGREIEGSLNHPFFVRKNLGRQTTGKRHVILQDEWMELKDLKPGYCVAVPKNIGELGSEDYKEDYKIDLLGFILANGNITSGNCRFSSQNEAILDRLRLAVSLYGCTLKHYKSDKHLDYHIVGQGTYKPHPIKDWLRELNLYGLDSHEKHIPDFIFTLKNQYIARLLNRMYGCDGWACVSKNGKPEIGYSTVSGIMAIQIVSLLNRFGIYADVRHKTTTLNGEKFHSRQIIISRRDDIVKFVDNINLFTKEDKAEYVKQISLTKGPSYRTEAYEEDNIVFIPVRSIETTGNKTTWDLSVPSIRNFIANSIISHNSEALCISTLHKIFTHSNFKVLVIAPFQSQIDLVFNRLMALINSNNILANSVSRHVKAPNYTIELYNGSRVTGFTAGSKSGQGAASARGQTANMLVLDEADYLSAADIDASLATIINFADASVWMSSTPSGKRERFFSACHSTLFKEFHFYSSVNPNWTEEMDQLFRENLTEDGYSHEILAEFGSQEEGVYQVKYVEAAQADYEYTAQKANPNWIYTMGVDWNDRKIGVTIAVVGYDPITRFFCLVDKCIVSRSEYTQLAACEKVADYNRIWNPFSIYVDRGFGAAQLEILTKFGYDSLRDKNKGAAHPDSRLAQIVKAYDFGGSIEIRDLFTKQPIKKAAKPFLVENSVRRFETCTFKYPKSDENLTAALLGYIIKRVTQSGVPVYEEQNERVGDHLLDAINLALVAFTLEKTDFGKPKHDSRIAFSGKIGDPSEIKETSREKSAEHKPKEGRTSFINSSVFRTGLPAAHTQMESSVQLWSWPGFGHDTPKPTIRTTQQTFGKSSSRNLFGRRPSPPHRKKF